MAIANEERNAPIASINVTPLIDVMLVLLIVFMIAAPLATLRIAVDLPQPTPDRSPKPSTIDLAIGADGALRWNGQSLSRELFELQLAFEAKKHPQPMLEISVDPLAEYEVLADVMGTAKNIGMTRVGFER